MRFLAYLDPASGSMLLQVLLGGIAGVAVAIKMFGKRVFRIFTFWKKHEPEPVGPSSPSAVAATARGEHEEPVASERGKEQA